MSGEWVSKRPFGIPDQFLVRQPAGALDETAFDLAARDAAINRVADIVQNIDAADVHHAGEPIDFHFAHRRADREIMKRFSAAGLAIVMNVRRVVEAGRAQTRPREIGALQQFRERESATSDRPTSRTMLSLKTISFVGTASPVFFRQHLGGERAAAARARCRRHS